MYDRGSLVSRTNFSCAPCGKQGLETFTGETGIKHISMLWCSQESKFTSSQTVSLQIFGHQGIRYSVADNAINIYMTAIYQLIPVFLVKVPRSYFSMRPCRVCMKVWFGDEIIKWAAHFFGQDAKCGQIKTCHKHLPLILPGTLKQALCQSCS